MFEKFCWSVNNRYRRRKNEKVSIRASIEWELSSRVDQRVLNLFGRVENGGAPYS